MSLADKSDKDKAFRVSATGKVFGISYDLDRWTLFLSEDKMGPLLQSLRELEGREEIDNGHMMTLIGRLNHYQWLVPGGPWQWGFLMRMQDA